MDYNTIIMGIGSELVKLFIGLVLTLFSVYYGVKFFDSLTRNIEEWKEIKKGNLAVGLMFSAVVLSIAILTAPGIFILVSALNFGSSTPLVVFGIGILTYIVTFLISLFSVYISVRLLDAMDMQEVDKIAALKKGNVAMGVFVAAVIISISLVMVFLEISSLLSIFPIVG